MLTAIILSDGCHKPTTDRRLLTAATKDAFSLLAKDGPKGPLEPRLWSVNLLRLRPERILVRERGVEIVTQSYFDGGWGYHVTAERSSLPMPEQCYVPVEEDIYWHGPC